MVGSPSLPPTSGVASASRPSTLRARRRRQRTARVTAAVVLLAQATGAVLVALATRSRLWPSVASLVALAAGWAAARILHSELLETRRQAARERAAQARAYRTLFSDRAAEHAEFTRTMTERLVRRDRDVGVLEDFLVAAQLRAAGAEARVQRESRRANEAQERVVELRERVEELEIREAQRDDELAVWPVGTGVVPRTGGPVPAAELMVQSRDASPRPRPPAGDGLPAADSAGWADVGTSPGCDQLVQHL